MYLCMPIVRQLRSGIACLFVLLLFGIPLSAGANEPTWLEFNSAGNNASNKGRFKDALLLYETALAKARIANVQPKALAVVMNNLALLYIKLGRYADSERLYKEAIAITSKASDSDSTFLGNLGFLYLSQGRYDEAEPLLKQVLARSRTTLGGDHLDTAIWCNNLGGLYRDQGRYAEAEHMFKDALLIWKTKLGPNHPDTARALNNLSGAYDGMGRYADAEPLCMAALTIRKRVLGLDHPDTARTMNNLAGIYVQQGRYADAELLYKEALAIRVRVLGPDHTDTAQTLNNLALVYFNQERFADAEPMYKRSLSIRMKVFGPDHPDTAQSINNLALLYLCQRRYADSEPLYQQALAICKKAVGSNHPDTGKAIKSLARLYRSQGRYGDAEQMYRTAQLINELNFGKTIISAQWFTTAASRQMQYVKDLIVASSLPTELNSDLQTLVRRIKGFEEFPTGDLSARFSECVSQLPLIEFALFDESTRNRDIDIVGALLKARAYHSKAKHSLLVAQVDLLVGCRFESLDGQSDELVERSADVLESLVQDTDSSVVSQYSPIYGTKSACAEAICRLVLCDAFLLAENGYRDRAVRIAKLASNFIDSQSHLLSLKSTNSLILDTTEFFKLNGDYAQARIELDKGFQRLVGLNSATGSSTVLPTNRSDVIGLDASTNPDLEANLLIALTDVAFSQADYNTVRNTAEKALALPILRSPSRSADRMKLQLALSQSASSLGSVEDGLKFANEAAETEQSISSKNTERSILVKMAQARALLSNNRPKDAEEIVKVSIQELATESSGMTDSSGVQNTSDKAAPSLLASVGTNKELFADLYLTLADSQFESRNFKDARLSFNRALDITRKNVARSAISARIDEIFGIAQCDKAVGENESASSLAFQGAAYLNEYINQVFPELSFAEQRNFIHKLKNYSSSMLAMCSQDKDLPNTYWYLMRWRGLLVEGLRRQSLLSVKANDSRIALTYQQWLQAKRELVHLSSSNSNNPSLKSRVNEVSETKESLERMLLGSNNTVDPILKINVSDFANSLSVDEVLIDLLTYTPVTSSIKSVSSPDPDPLASADLHHAAIIVTKGGLKFVDIPNAAKILDAIKQWRRFGISSFTRGQRTFEIDEPNHTESANIERAKVKEKEAWEVLQKLLWAPILSALPENTTKLIICDDEELTRIPWSKLADDSSDGRTFLTARIDSPREWILLKDSDMRELQSPSPATKDNILLVGDITYNDDRLKLAGSKDEIDAIEKLILELSNSKNDSPSSSKSSISVRPLRGSVPTKAQVTALLPQSAIAHFATHGFFAESEPFTMNGGKSRSLLRSTSSLIGTLASVRNPLLSSGILLAPNTDNNSSSRRRERTKLKNSDQHDSSIRPQQLSGETKLYTASGDIAIDDEGKLTAEEILELNLRNCDLIILSACDTGRGTEERGQGILGLRSAIMSAGAKTLIISLWHVDDEATRYLMTEFYKQLWLNHKSKAEALRLAQDAVKNNKDNLEWKHPFYWAPWVLIGEGW